MKSLAPIGSIRFCILLALTKEPMCGADIERQVMEDSRGAIYIHFATIYKTLNLLEHQGLIIRTDRVPMGYGKHYYRLTDHGQKIVKAEVQRLKDLITASHGRLN